jgi:hypothetical protein
MVVEVDGVGIVDAPREVVLLIVVDMAVEEVNYERTCACTC